MISENSEGERSATFEEVVALEEAKKMILEDCVKLGKKVSCESATSNAGYTAEEIVCYAICTVGLLATGSYAKTAWKTSK